MRWYVKTDVLLAPSRAPSPPSRPVALQGMSALGKLVLTVTWLGILVFSWRLAKATFEGKPSFANSKAHSCGAVTGRGSRAR